MLVIRLKRIGKKHQASYRVVVSERRHKMVGEHTEDLGWFNPGLNKGEFNVERVKYWMSVGAKPSETVTNMLIDRGVLSGKKIAKHKSRPKKAEDARSEGSAQPKEAPKAPAVAAPAVAEAMAGKPAAK